MCVFLQNCASFNKKDFKDNYLKINKNNYQLLSGNYKALNNTLKVSDSTKINDNLFDILNLKRNNVHKKAGTVSIQFIENKYVKISLLEGNKTLDSFTTEPSRKELQHIWPRVRQITT